MALSEILWYFIPAVCAGALQGMTGFGSGIVLAVFYPVTLGVIQAASVNQTMAVIICTGNVICYHRHVRWKMVLAPVLIYLPLYFVALRLAGRVNAELLKPVLGTFLVMLAVYFLRFSEHIRLKSSRTVMVVCVFLSAVIDAFFGLGGPAMVIYFLSAIDDKEGYLGTIQSFFLVTGCYGVIVRAANGALPLSLAPVLAAAAAGVIAGPVIVRKFVEKADINRIKRWAYYLIGAAGVVSLTAALVGG